MRLVKKFKYTNFLVDTDSESAQYATSGPSKGDKSSKMSAKDRMRSLYIGKLQDTLGEISCTM